MTVVRSALDIDINVGVFQQLKSLVSIDVFLDTCHIVSGLASFTFHCSICKKQIVLIYLNSISVVYMLYNWIVT